MTLSIPTIHLNGTAQAELIEQLSVAAAAVMEAIRAVQGACPNGRDYYTQGQTALASALDGHSRRLKALEGIHEELMEIAVAIDEGGHKVVA